MNTLVVQWIKSPINYQVRNGHEKSRSGNNLGATKDQRYKAKTSHWLPIIIHMLTLLAVGLASFPQSAIEPQPVNTIAYQAVRKARMALSFQVALLDDAASSVSVSYDIALWQPHSPNQMETESHLSFHLSIRWGIHPWCAYKHITSSTPTKKLQSAISTMLYVATMQRF